MTYQEQQQNLQQRAQEMRKTLLEPVVADDGHFISDSKQQAQVLESAVKGSIFEGVGENAPQIAAMSSAAVQDFCAKHGRAPSDDLLASAHQGIENILEMASNKRGGLEGTIFEAADMSTSEGVLMTNRMLAMVLPVMLQSITSNLVTFIPGQFNQSEIFKVTRRAGSTFNGMNIGDEIDTDFASAYGSMDQRYDVAAGNGTEVGGAGSTTPNYFAYDSNTALGYVAPFKKKSVKVYHDRDLVAQDNGEGNLQGTFVVGATTITVSGAVNYATGNVNPIFSTAPANAIEIAVGFDVDIEANSALIPLVNQEMSSKILRPHEAAIAGDTTLQALWLTRREYGLNLEGMLSTGMRNLLAASKDRKILKDLYWAAKGEATWDKAVPAGLYFQEHYEAFKQSLLTASTTLSTRTKRSGLVGMVGDVAFVNLCMSMKSPNFVPAPGYRFIPQPHYCGRLFGMFDLYCDPNKGTTYEALGFAKGNGVGEASYVSGDAIPALSFKHPTMRDLKSQQTMWELAYRDVQPFDGREYLINIKMT